MTLFRRSSLNSSFLVVTWSPIPLCALPTLIFTTFFAAFSLPATSTSCFSNDNEQSPLPTNLLRYALMRVLSAALGRWWFLLAWYA
eukprot:CAMPEP_0182513632 /NCGR_PEP_ID=MMETSP1321-20130603/34345_1 /TAXON_ID=91990 /ORGANISM="Bolidomonas sp., Strain RCC1657" /LENGTH=85 /DNA_ID=CAMNT_0024720687 /DNA_START=81 /DNA_END=334 /DNA_ORIENTATION=+